MRSVFRLMQSWRMMRLPLVSSSLRSVLNSSKTFTMKLVKYESSEEDEIWARSWRSYLTTSSDGSDSVLSSAGNVPSSRERI